MWPKSYRDYKEDAPLKKIRTEPGKGMVGTEMNELNGWGSSFHHDKKRKKGKLRSFFSILFGNSKDSDS